jgi:hypothetical protein
MVSYCGVNLLYVIDLCVTDLCVTDTCAVVQENVLPSRSPWTRTSFGIGITHRLVFEVFWLAPLFLL